MNLLSLLWRKVAAEGAWLTLLGVAAAAAYLYVDGARAKADRDALSHWADVTCAHAGTPFAAARVTTSDANGNPVTLSFDRGQRCRTKVTALAAFKASVDENSARILADAMADRDAKSRSDTILARHAAEQARDALKNMEKLDAEADRTNRVDRDWFAGVNDVAGLRAPAD